MSRFTGAVEAEAYDERARALSAKSLAQPITVLSDGEDDRQRVEFFRPEDATNEERLPILIFLHGGAWIAGGFEWLRFMAPALKGHGALFAAVSYRLAPHHKWPSQQEDAVAAIRLVQAQAERFGGDSDRIVVGGHSAGGQMAAMAVLSGDIRPVRACMPVSSPMDMRHGRVASETGKGRIYRYLLAQPEDDIGASPICHIGSNRTPFHLTWGDHDFEHIGDSCQRMVEAMSGAGQPVHHNVMSDATHFDTHLHLHDPLSNWYRAFRSFTT